MADRINVGDAVWAHHPRGGVVTGYACKRRWDCTYNGYARPMADSVRDAKAGNNFATYPIAQVYKGAPPPPTPG